MTWTVEQETAEIGVRLLDHAHIVWSAAQSECETALRDWFDAGPRDLARSTSGIAPRSIAKRRQHSICNGSGSCRSRVAVASHRSKRFIRPSGSIDAACCGLMDVVRRRARRLAGAGIRAALQLDTSSARTHCACRPPSAARTDGGRTAWGVRGTQPGQQRRRHQRAATESEEVVQDANGVVPSSCSHRPTRSRSRLSRGANSPGEPLANACGERGGQCLPAGMR